MSMLAAITRHELRRSLRDRALPWLIILFAALAAYGAWNGARWAEERTDTVQIVADEATDGIAKKREQFAELKPGATPGFAGPQFTPFRPVLRPGVMAPLSIGQAEAYPYAARVAPMGDIRIFDAFKVDVDNPAVRAAGRFDLAFVIVFVLPLVLMAATFDLWSRERERGISAMVVSQPVSVTTLLAGKALSRALVLLTPIILATLAVLYVAGARDLAALAAVALVVAAYGAFWIALASLINVFAKRSTEAALAGGAAWLTIVVLAPALILATVDIIVPAPSALQFTSAYQAQSQDIRKAQRLAREAKGPEVIRDPAPNIPDRTRGFLKDRAIEDRTLAPLIRRHEEALAERRAVLNSLRLFLPAVATQDALDRIAGSDADRALSFQAQAMAFMKVTKDWMAERFDRDALLTSDDYDHIPKFEFKEPPAGAFQTGVLIDLAAILAAGLLLAAGVALGRRAATTI